MLQSLPSASIYIRRQLSSYVSLELCRVSHSRAANPGRRLDNREGTSLPHATLTVNALEGITFCLYQLVGCAEWDGQAAGKSWESDAPPAGLLGINCILKSQSLYPACIHQCWGAGGRGRRERAPEINKMHGWEKAGKSSAPSAQRLAGIAAFTTTEFTTLEPRDL